MPACAVLVAVALAPGCGGGPSVSLDASVGDGGTPTLAAARERVRTESGVPAIGATVLRGDGTLDQAVTGVRRRGDTTSATSDDLFHLGSNTKAMTAVLVATFVDDGDLAWTTTVEELLGDDLAAIHGELRDVTFVELLAHTSGLLDEDALALVPPLNPDLPVEAQRLAAARQVLAAAPTGTRGEHAYANVGYVLAGVMLERFAEAPWEALMEERLFAPLGMASCGFYAPGTPGTVDQPWGHLVEGQRLRAVDPGDVEAELPLVLGPAGLAHCAMDDWARFLAMTLRGARGSEDELVSAAAFDALLTPRADGYALGWVVGDEPLPALAHDGSNLRFTSLALVAPDHDLALLAVTNVGLEVGGPALNGLFVELLPRYGVEL
ncbi:MAG: serine hydrolase domain-containing protein [Sandaracinaceae bacterium]